MSFDDFCLCTPSEFRSIFESWRKHDESKAHLVWETTREEIVSIYQLVSGKQLNRHEVMPFKWEKKAMPAKKITPSTPERVKELKERLKNNI